MPNAVVCDDLFTKFLIYRFVQWTFCFLFFFSHVNMIIGLFCLAVT